MGKVLGMIPGMGGIKEMLDTADLDRDMNRLFGIINAMTPDERRNPTRIIDQSRRRRIAQGAGVQPQEVNDLVKQFDGMASMMKGMAGLGMRDRMKQLQQLQSGIANPGARLAKPKGVTGKRLTAEERKKQKKQREKDARRRKRQTKD
jgi:signal recognition particle subunit SRP54